MVPVDENAKCPWSRSGWAILLGILASVGWAGIAPIKPMGLEATAAATGPWGWHFSRWWWCDLTANLLTCTGIGTTILEELRLCWDPPLELCRDPPEPDPLLPLRPALTLFHLARRFWNQILTWTSDSLSACAMCDRSVKLRYFFAWNSLSSSKSCSDVKAVLLLRALLLLQEEELVPQLDREFELPWK